MTAASALTDGGECICFAGPGEGHKPWCDAAEDPRVARRDAPKQEPARPAPPESAPAIASKNHFEGLEFETADDEPAPQSVRAEPPAETATTAGVQAELESRDVGDLTWLPHDETPLDHAACDYAEHGWLVIPVRGTVGKVCACKDGAECPNPGKHPIGKAWQKTASSDPVTVADARRGHAITPNVGLAMGGPNRRIAIDVDGEKGKATWAKLVAGREVPRTATSASGRVDGGSHLFFDVPDGLDLSKLKNRASVMKDRLGEGVDVRAEGGQVVAPPSMHASGKRYRWAVRARVAELPQWLYDELTREAEPKGKANVPRDDAPAQARTDARLAKYWASVLDNAQRDVASAVEGTRNETLYRKACKLYELCIGERLSKSEASSVLEAAARAAGMKRTEIEKSLGSAWKKVEGGGGKRMPDLHVHDGGHARPREGSASSSQGGPPPADWDDDDVDDTSPLTALQRDGHGRVKKTTANVALLAEHHEELEGVVAFDDFNGEIVKLRPLPAVYTHPARPPGPWTDGDSKHLLMWFASKFKLDVKVPMLEDAVAIVAGAHAFHPVRDYFNGLLWDGVPRLDEWLVTYCGAEPTDFVRGTGSRWVISAVARTFEPGCQADVVLVLEGEQGVGKSTALRTLVGDAWFSDTLPVLGDKDAMQALRGALVFELPEMASMKGREVERVKAFFTTRIDAYRPSYGRRTVRVPRQCVFAATTNEEHYLTDRTGNRRFLPVRCERVEIDTLARDRDQLWAEAVARYRAGEKWHVAGEFGRLAMAAQSEREAGDSWDDALAAWLRNPVVQERGPDGLMRDRRIDLSLGVPMHEALVGCGKRPGLTGMVDEQRMGKCFRALGYKRDKVWIPAEGRSLMRWVKSK